MTIDELREEMEEDLTWRLQELKNFKNLMSLSQNYIDEEVYFKPLIVMLYSHYEGFAKLCFLAYLKYINSQNIQKKQLMSKPELLASSMDEHFKYYDNKDRKNKFFKRKDKDDRAIHMIYRRADLVQSFNNFLEEKVTINENVINTESNLWSHVLEKNFYKVSIKHTIMKSFYSDIDKLVQLRNSIAHGSKKRGVKKSFYEKIEVSTIKIMEKLILVFNREAKLLKGLLG